MMAGKPFGARGAVCALAVIVVVGLIDVWVVPSAAAAPSTAPGQPQPTTTDVTPVTGQDTKTPPDLAQRSSRTAWPAGDADSAGVAVTVTPGQKTRVGAGIVSVTLPASGRTAIEARVRVLPPDQSRQLVGDGVVIALQLPAGVAAQVEVDYSTFADAVGGGFGSRLKLVSLPACGLATPDRARCQVQTDLGSVNDAGAETVTTLVDAPQLANGTIEDWSNSTPTDSATVAPDSSAEPLGRSTASTDRTDDPSASASTEPEPVAPSAQPAGIRGVGSMAPVAPVRPRFVGPNGNGSGTTVLLAAVGGSSSAQGDYTATSMTASSSWAAGGNTGAFTWSYPMPVTAVPGGPNPALALSYSSGSTDGGVSNTNNQSSWVGEGFDFANSYIERTYVSCADDQTGGNNPTKTGDLCWLTDPAKTALYKWDNATLALNGTVHRLVSVDTSHWKAEDDPGITVVEAQNSSATGDYWTVTTIDGVKYNFGIGSSNSTTTPRTNSTWFVPVAGNQPGEPGFSATFASSFLSVPWRWNLDLVVPPNQRSMTLFYAKETNQYLENGTTSVSYDRGGYLTRIQYGEAAGAQTNDAAPGRVVFTVEERCDITVSSTCKTASPTASTAAAWPDVPLDAACDSSYCPSQKTSPTFFTRKRLVNVATFTRNSANTGYDTVDRWDLGYQFLKPTDGSAVSMWLSTIVRTGLAGGAVVLPAVTLSPVMLASSITGSAMSRPRLAMITTEAGGQTTVTYSAPECAASTVPTATIASNSTRCMPTFFAPGTGTPTLQWFNKYVVTQVVDHDVVPLGTTIDPSVGVSQDNLLFPNAPPGCANIFEWSADLSKGGYLC